MNEERHCRREGCVCTHQDPCYAGWVEVTHIEKRAIKDRFGNESIIESAKEVAMPCGICDPERAQIFASASSNSELQKALKNRSSLNRKKVYEEAEESKTRIL